MSVPDQSTIFPYVGNGVTTTFAYGCYLLSADDLIVTINGVEITTGFTVNGIGSQSGGAVIFNTPPANGVKIVLYRSIAVKRDTDYQRNGDFRSDTVNRDFDRLWMALQDNRRDKLSSLRYPIAENLDGELPTFGSRLGMMLGFDPVDGRATMIPLPSSIGAGDRIPFNLVSGVDFNPGDAVLALPRVPGSQGNIEVNFDGVPQDFTQWSVAGNALTIPGGVSSFVTRVWGYIGTTLSATIPPNRSVGEDQLVWGDSIQRVCKTIAEVLTLDTTVYTRAFALGYSTAGDDGGGHLWFDADDNVSVPNGGTIFNGPNGGRWKRANTTVLSLLEFGAKNTGNIADAATNTDAIQRAMTWASSGGKLLRSPAGLYTMSAGVSIVLNNGTGIGVGGLRLTFVGDGPGSTCFQYAGAAAPTLFSFTGAYADRLLLEGFRVQHTDQASVTNNGIGIAIIGQVNTAVRDVHVFRMTTGIRCVDINACEFDSVYLGYNYQGLTAQIGTTTYPNALVFRNLYLMSNYQYGAVINSGVTVTFDGGSVEGNGVDASGAVQPGAAGIAFSNNGVNGSASLRVLGTYFEGNSGSADVYITHNAIGTYVFQGNTFNRIDSTKFVSNNVVIDMSALGAGSAPCKVEWSGNGFWRGGSYAVDPSRRYVAYLMGASFDQLYIDDDGTNNYQDAAEVPSIHPVRAAQYGAFSQLQAQAYVVGASGTMTSNRGISSISRVSAGVYNVVFARPLGGTPMISVALGNGQMSWSYSNLTANSVTINTFSANVPTDPLSFQLLAFPGV
ncbi:hypothetical protein ACJBUE_22440 (plasmid) [Ralstonia syzygii subsp. celebesensis]|nr:hypothetical protein [Ralstonia syzygii]QQV57695.1 hypothetical protein JK151_19800 [Ralstonia syzygii subsp. celebesensis]CCA83789.1 hypothetical protein BDB_mp70243 [blood disease bacterium R229]